MSEKPDHQIIGEMIIRDFKLSSEQFDSVSSEDILLQELKKVVDHLLDQDMGYLLNCLYRLDLDEQLMKKILAESTPDQVSEDLSRAIIERLKKKVYFRKKYRGDS